MRRRCRFEGGLAFCGGKVAATLVSELGATGYIADAEAALWQAPHLQTFGYIDIRCR